ncbi:MAG TPA: potassium channel protein [Rubrobacter sp.]|jgi:voltage-gated potassium channel|nr:potassium channel protein [Rubrobacter sp.]
MAEGERKKATSKAIFDRTVYEPRAALRRVQGALLALVIIAAAGVFGYMVFEGWGITDALYMTVITLTTVGYREVRALDATGQLWTMLLLITGVGTLFYAAVSSVELVVEGTIRGYFRRRGMESAISKLSGHQLLCGYGRVGRQVAAEFASDGVPFVVIDQDPETVEECLAEGYLAILGEASDDAVLEEAGVRRARGLVAAVDSDADNVFVVLSARKLNPKLHIVARASSDESAAKLEMAGAERTLSPYAVGGRRLASLATQPLIVDFLDIVTRGEKGIEFRLEEFDVPEDSFIADRTIGELRIGERTGAMILATRNKEGTFDTTPSAKGRLRAGDTLIVLGTREQIARLEQHMRGKELQ